MITRDINEVAKELRSMVIDAIYHIAMERQEDEIELNILVHQEHLIKLNVYFPADDEEFDTTDGYLNEMDIEVLSEYTDNSDGLIYSNEYSLTDLDLSSLLEIYNLIKD